MKPDSKNGRMAVRLAFRVEGDLWNCYFAKEDSMEGAILLGSIRKNISENPAVNEAFMATMKLAMEIAIKQVFGRPADYVYTRSAPEHERTKE